VTKLKDGRDGAQFSFRLLDVVLGTDEDGDDITSCIVEFGGAISRKKRVKPVRGNIEKLVLSTVHELLGFGAESITQKSVIDACLLQIPANPDTRDHRNRNVLRAMESLHLGGYIQIAEGVVMAGENANL
jgi:hypothetical protein